LSFQVPWFTFYLVFSSTLVKSGLYTGAASVLIDDQTLWVTGGESGSGCVIKTEFLFAGSPDWVVGPDLPECLMEHCVVKLDNNTILITGG
jgi:hypothetical protein